MNPQTLAVIAIGVLGLLIGSFLNVVIYRVPRHESLLFPPSRCPGCDQPIKARHNVPVVSWLVLRGHCASCRAPISARYPLVELGTGLLFAAVTLRLGLSPYLPACLVLVAVGISAAMIDVDGQLLPAGFVVPAYAVGAALLLPAGATESGDAGWRHALWSLAGVVALIGVYVAVATTSQRAVEPGLVLLAGLVGLHLGWLSWQVLMLAVAGSLAAGVLARSALTTTGRRIGASTLPIGTVLLVAAAVALLLPLPLASV